MDFRNLIKSKRSKRYACCNSNNVMQLCSVKFRLCNLCFLSDHTHAHLFDSNSHMVGKAVRIAVQKTVHAFLVPSTPAYTCI